MAPTTQESLCDQPKDPTLNMEHLVTPLSAHEVTSVLETLWNPETDHIWELRAKIEKSIKDADTNWQVFLQNLEQKTFVSVWACKREGIAALAKFTDSRKAAIDLKDYARGFFSTRIKALDSQYWAFQRQYNALKAEQRAWAAPTLEMANIAQQQAKIKELQTRFEAAQPRVNTLLNDFVSMMENKLDQHKVILYWTEYKWKRVFEKDQEKKAKIKAENGNRRDPENASKYLGGWPTPEKGKCGITDAQSKVDKATMSDALQNAKKWGGDKRTGIVERSPEAQKTIPAVDADIDQLVTEMNTLIWEIPALGKALKAVQAEK